MQEYNVVPMKTKKNIAVSVPGSKSITNRALMLAAMSNNICTLKGVLFSDDSRAFLSCLINLGFDVKVDEADFTVLIQGENGHIPNNNAEINVRSAGTVARFMTVFLAVAGGNYVLKSSQQMKKRPMKELLDSLKEKGVKIKYLEEEGHFPFELHSEGMKNKSIAIDTTTSSQYASALLMAAVINGMEVKLTGSRVNGAYINITLKMMEQFGIKFNKDKNTYNIEAQNYVCSKYNIEPDMSAACYFYAMAILLRTKSVVQGIHMNSMQGDIKFLNVLKEMGCILTDTDLGVEVDGSGVDSYNGMNIDMSDFSDQALTMAVVGAFGKTDTQIKNIGHIRGQESDRIEVIVTELKKLGCNAEIKENNGITDVVIHPGKLHGASIETYDDHRVAMSFALAGLVVDGVIIKNPMCCKKTFENYFDVIDQLTK